MIASGTLLPLMDLIFGKVVSVFSDFTAGVLAPVEFRSDVTGYTLWVIYLFIAKFVLTYIWNILVSLTAIRTTKNLRVSFLQAVRSGPLQVPCELFNYE